MADLLEHLGKDTLPDTLLREFVDWCVWQQARPALSIILKKTGLDAHMKAIQAASDLVELAEASEAAGKSANEARQRTGPLGLSTAEAASFLAHKMANTALSDPLDAEAISFYAVQIMGWKAFADSDFLDPTSKPAGETEARQIQEDHLRQLWQAHGKSDEA